MTLRDSVNAPTAGRRAILWAVLCWRLGCAADAAEAPAAWPALEPYFTPPAQYATNLGTYRSPLRFDHGAPVKTAADWARRRLEIVAYWHRVMGPWPAVIEHPQLEELARTHRENFTQTRVRLEIAPDRQSEGWLLVPDGRGPFPAALVVFYEPETSIGLGTKSQRDFALRLTRRGFVTLSIGTPGGNAWKPDIGTARCQPLSFHAYVAANCWHALADRPEVDARRIGVVGHSYGGKWALFAGALWDRFAAVAVSDPGIVFDESRPNVNYWEPWYLGLDPRATRPQAGVPAPDNPRTGAYRQLVAAGRDLHELHALIAPRPLLVSGGSEDPPARWIALNHAVAVNRLLGFEARVGMSNRPNHEPTSESNALIDAFFVHFLRADQGRAQPRSWRRRAGAMKAWGSCPIGRRLPVGRQGAGDLTAHRDRPAFLSPASAAAGRLRGSARPPAG